MTRDPRYDVLFEPIDLGPKTLPNRFWQTPYATFVTTASPHTTAAYRGMRAEGGWGAVSTEYTSIAPEDELTPGLGPTIWDEGDVHNLSLITAAVHQHGALAAIELGYGGPISSGLDSRLASRGPSQCAVEVVDGLLTYCWEASEREIHGLQDAYAAGALRARDAGFDIVNIYGATSHGPGQYLSPYFNRRTDRYGGSLENRVRFYVETLDAVRNAVGSDCAIATRLGMDELLGPAGLRLAEAVRVIEMLDPLVDVWDFTLGGVDFSEEIASSRFYPENHMAEWMREARAVATKPVIGVGRFTSPDTMLAAIKSDQLDIIGAARPSISDPFLPRKIKEGRLDEIRECIGCNACLARYMVGSRIVCTQNATANEEYRRGWHPESFSVAKNAENDVVVVGAGPAGLECAMVLGKRGMRRIHLVDAAAEIGGMLRWIPRLPRLGEWGRLLDYRRIQLDKLKNVQIVPKTQLSADDVLEYGAEYVVVATGAPYAEDGTNFVDHAPIRGADASQPHCLTPEQVMLGGKEVPGKRVALVDYEGYVAGVGLTELLRARGHEVVYITPFDRPAAYARYTKESQNVHRLMTELGVSMLGGQLVQSIEPGMVTTTEVIGDSFRRPPDEHGDVRDAVAVPSCVEVDAVVLVTDRRSDTELYLGLMDREDEWHAAGVKGIYRIGDCVAPRHLSEVIFDGHRLGREIDSPNPAVPLPWRRERHLWGATRDDSVNAHEYLGELGAGGAPVTGARS